MEDIEEKIEEIEASVPPVLGHLPFTLIERQSRRITKLVANSGDTQPIDGRNTPYRYSFNEPIFLSHLTIHVSGYNQYDKFRFEVTTINDETKQLEAHPDEGKVYADIDELCTSVSFQPPSAWLRSPMLQSVELFGFRQSETAAFLRFALNLDDVKIETIQKIQESQTEAEKIIAQATESQSVLNGLNTEISDTKALLATTQADSKAATNNLNEIVARSGATSKQLEGTEERLANLRGDIKIETQKKEQVQAEIVTSQTKLRELEGNINLFPSEISGFADQASSNNLVYLQYALIPLTILSVMFIILISGAVDLTTIITIQKVNLAAIIVSRMPYVAVASAVIYACYKLTKLFIEEVMNINRQRLSLTKISIIAKDISQAAETGLELSTDRIYANRLKVKMALLADHISHMVTTEPELIFPENLFSAPGLSKDEPAEDSPATNRTRATNRRRPATQAVASKQSS